MAACGASSTKNVSLSDLKGKLNSSVTSACGLSRSDQAKIDRTSEAHIRAGLWPRPVLDPKCEDRRIAERK